MNTPVAGSGEEPRSLPAAQPAATKPAARVAISLEMPDPNDTSVAARLMRIRVARAAAEAAEAGPEPQQPDRQGQEDHAASAASSHVQVAAPEAGAPQAGALRAEPISEATRVPEPEAPRQPQYRAGQRPRSGSFSLHHANRRRRKLHLIP